MEEMRGNQLNRKEYLKRQHGEVHQLIDEKEFFSKMKGEEKMVCHFYRNSEPCKFDPQTFTTGRWRRCTWRRCFARLTRKNLRI